MVLNYNVNDFLRNCGMHAKANLMVIHIGNAIGKTSYKPFLTLKFFIFKLGYEHDAHNPW